MLTLVEIAVVASYYLCFGVLLVYALHRLHLVRVRRRVEAAKAPDLVPVAIWPHVAVQLPLFNEPNVAARLMDAAAALQYSGRLEIQVLDDSTDSTSEIVAERVRAARSRGIEVQHIRRPVRIGFKAGALAEGMSRTSAEIFAVFDADFLPPSDFLTRTVPYFADRQVGMVQARWGHLNRDESVLTRVQALYLDGHFAVESAARHLDGCFFNFNGTAGLWRRLAIEQSGGWSASTLTEDLDLSYRAQLAGWKFVFLPELVAPAELPSEMSGFQGQQYRWAKGSIQTARKHLGTILDAALPLKVKVEAAFHLTNNAAYLMTLLLGLLLVPSVEIRYRVRSIPLMILDAALFLLSTYSLVVFCREGQRRVGRSRTGWRDLAFLIPLGIGLSATNAVAVVEGLVQSGGEFRRTPKRGASVKTCASERPRIPAIETILTLFFSMAMVALAIAGHWVALPFVGIFLCGYGYAMVQNASEWLRFSRRISPVSETSAIT